MRLPVIAMLVLGVSGVACAGGNGGETPTRPPTTETPTPGTFTLSPAVPPQSATVTMEVDWLILDTSTGEIQTLSRPESGPNEQPVALGVQWLSADVISVYWQDATYRVPLAGPTSITTPMPTPTLWGNVVERSQSPDGGWEAMQRTSPPRVEVWEQPAGAGYLLQPASVTGWSSAQPLLALLGNLCREFDLFVFDPNSAALTNVTESLPRIYAAAWSPDGMRIAAVVWGRSPEFWGVAVVSPADAGIEQYELPRGAYARTVVWSPDGRRLLMRNLFFGGGLCENPPYPETTVEPIR